MKKTLFVLIVLLSLVLSACGGGSADFPTGKFIKEGETDYGLIFRDDGTFSVFIPGNVTVVNGKYEADSGTFTEVGNDAGCKSPVKFKYTFDGSKLTFNYAGNPDDDLDCAGRHADFNNVTYTLSK